MADFFARKVAKHVLKESAANKFGTEDPYFDYVSPLDMNGNPTNGKPKKQKKATPPGLTKKEEKILKKVTRRAYRLDNCLNICGIRIGWGVVAGIIPGLGDVFDTLCALMVYRTCLAAELPTAIKSKMMLNIMVDFAIGLIPFLGDVADAFYRANTRNAGLLYSHLKARGATRIAEDEKVASRGIQGRDRSHSRGRGGTQQMKQLQSPTAPKRNGNGKGEPAPAVTSPRDQRQHRTPTSSGSENDQRRIERSPPATLQQQQQQQQQQQPPPRRFVTADDLAEPEPARVREADGRSGRGFFSRLLGGREPARPQERDVENLDDIPMR